jgi:DNA-binding transcriptional MerR regulator
MTVAGERHEAEAGAASHRIGEAARQIGVSPSALRLWERQGLVRPRRSAGGYRLYGTSDLERLRRIRRLREVDRVNASGIRHILSGGANAPKREADGARLRALRHRAGLSLRQTSERSGLSISFISAIERGTSGASVAALRRLVAALGATTLDLLDAGDAPRRLVTPQERRQLALDDGRVQIEQLAHGTRLLEPQLFVLAPGATSEGPYAHEGEEFLFLLEGRLRLWLGEAESYRLCAGDALSFPSTLPHRWRNDAAGETRLLWINTPPTF